jgi:hypothetical protein
MWKAKPVVASAVGGIQDQIVDGVSGVLLRDLRDHAELAAALQLVLTQPDSSDSQDCGWTDPSLWRHSGAARRAAVVGVSQIAGSATANCRPVTASAVIRTSRGLSPGWRGCTGSSAASRLSYRPLIALA